MNTTYSTLVQRLILILSMSQMVGLCSAHAQVAPDSGLVVPDVQESAETLLDQVETESDRSGMIDRLNWMQEHPFDLNTVSKEELGTIPRLTPAEVAAIIALRKSIKRFTTVTQLALIEDGGEEILRKLGPYVSVGKKIEHDRASFAVTSRVAQDLQPRRGTQDGTFGGSALKTSTRVSIEQSRNLQAGFALEKDAGERMSDGFTSGYLVVRDWSFISQAVIGDYVVEAGQGLVLWRASAFGKGSEAVSVVRKVGPGVQAYRSMDEFNFMRGTAISSIIDIGQNTLFVTALFSRHALSASGDSGAITSLYEDGLFRTVNEIRKKSNVVESIAGGRVLFHSHDEWSIGTSFCRSTFNKPFVADRQSEFAGSNATVAGVDGEVTLGWLAPGILQMTLFGEMARSGNGAGAGIAGSILSLTHGTNLAVIYRNYSPGFTSFHGTGFGERSDTRNERGFYIGADVRLTRSLHFYGYLDQYTFPSPTYNTPMPESGRDILLHMEAEFSNGVDFSLRYTNKAGEVTEPSVDAYTRSTRSLVDRIQQKVRLTATYQANKLLQLRGRIETTLVQYAIMNRSERGYLFYQDFEYSLSRRFTAEARLIFFVADSYDARLYEYENDLRGVFSSPALYGKGRRWYLQVRWKAGDMLSFSSKYSETQYDDRTSIGTGPMEIQGDVDNRIAMQVELKL